MPYYKTKIVLIYIHTHTYTYIYIYIRSAIETHFPEFQSKNVAQNQNLGVITNEKIN